MGPEITKNGSVIASGNFFSHALEDSECALRIKQVHPEQCIFTIGTLNLAIETLMTIRG